MVTYSTGLRTELQVTGENSGTWGTITNNNFSQVFEFAIAGVYAVPAITTGTSTTLTNADGNDLTSSAGDATATADFDITVTGNGLTSYIGDAGQETSYLAPNVSATASIGTLNIQTDVTFTITGVSATSSTGTLRGTFWQEVDDSQTAVWVEVDKAA